MLWPTSTLHIPAWNIMLAYFSTILFWIITGRGIRHKPMSMRSWRLTSLLLPWHFHTATRELHNSANLCFVLMRFYDREGYLHFCLYFQVVFVNLGTFWGHTTTWYENKGIEWWFLDVNTPLDASILLVIFMMSVDT